MREVAGSTPGLDFYLLCELICVFLRLIVCYCIYLIKVGIFRKATPLLFVGLQLFRPQNHGGGVGMNFFLNRTSNNLLNFCKIHYFTINFSIMM
jgi:hypothetical protein